MTKYRITPEQRQKKSVRTVYQMIRNDELKGKYGENFKHVMSLDGVAGFCKYFNLVTVKQILKAIR